MFSSINIQKYRVYNATSVYSTPKQVLFNLLSEMVLNRIHINSTKSRPNNLDVGVLKNIGFFFVLFCPNDLLTNCHYGFFD